MHGSVVDVNHSHSHSESSAFLLRNYVAIHAKLHSEYISQYVCMNEELRKVKEIQGHQAEDIKSSSFIYPMIFYYYYLTNGKLF